MTQRSFKVRALGEIAIRCADMESMVAFYRDIIGLEVLSGGHRETITFFKIAEGFGGHTSVLALFHHDAGMLALHEQSPLPPETGNRSSLHHIALSLLFEEQQNVMEYYASKGIDFHVEEFAWIGWRGIFTKDPEGNTVELVAYDPSSTHGSKKQTDSQ
ncbi:MAG: VOC family protein [Rhizobiaceae bacterium]|nr:VOC family protein [Rhizobiaceae bacterium]